MQRLSIRVWGGWWLLRREFVELGSWGGGCRVSQLNLVKRNLILCFVRSFTMTKPSSEP